MAVEFLEDGEGFFVAFLDDEPDDRVSVTMRVSKERSSHHRGDSGIQIEPINMIAAHISCSPIKRRHLSSLPEM